MDAQRFDTLARSLTEVRSRRGALAMLLGGALGLLGLTEAAAKKGKGKKKKGKKNKNKDGTQNPSPPSPLAPGCTDGVQNGSETGVDCGGGTCPRCTNGKTCASRTDCTGALCTGGACQSCVNAVDCGLDADGVTGCFCRDTVGGPKVCTKQACRLVPGGACTACTGSEQCAPAGGADIECCLPCGA